MSLLMQLLIGRSISRYLPAIGTAGLLRSCVRGYRRVPRPPPRIRLKTLCIGSPRFTRKGKEQSESPPSCVGCAVGSFHGTTRKKRKEKSILRKIAPKDWLLLELARTTACSGNTGPGLNRPECDWIGSGNENRMGSALEHRQMFE